ncbi:MAG: serine hydrolase [Desulfomonile sp.]|nr:serine hydrolase [Desulfomonile sp.]
MKMSKNFIRSHLGVLVSVIGSVFFLCQLIPIAVEAAHAKDSAAAKRRGHPVVSQSRTTPVKAPNKTPTHDAKKTSERPVVKAKAVYCINLATNQIIMSRNADQQLPVASLSKLVTALVALDQFSLNQKVKVPDQVKGIPKSVAGLKPGDMVAVKDLLHGLLIGSANDCAETLACAFPGGKTAFVREMNKKAASLGTRHTVFYTPSGLDRKSTVKKDDKTSVMVKSNTSTAREIAHIARHAFSNKTIRAICLKSNYVMSSAESSTGYPVRTTNKLLRDKLPIIGGKTGFTSRAGHCMATKFTPGRDAILIVVLGSPDHFRDTRLVYQTALQKVKAPDRKPPIHTTLGNDDGFYRSAVRR